MHHTRSSRKFRGKRRSSLPEKRPDDRCAGTIVAELPMLHLALPTAIEPLTSAAGGGGGHRRELQRSSGSADRVRITVQATAPTAEETDRAIAGFQAFAANGRRRQQEAGHGDAAAMCTAELAEKDAELAEKDAAHAATNVQMAELMAEKDAEIEALRHELKKK